MCSEPRALGRRSSHSNNLHLQHLLLCLMASMSLIDQCDPWLGLAEVHNMFLRPQELEIDFILYKHSGQCSPRALNSNQFIPVYVQGHTCHGLCRGCRAAQWWMFSHFPSIPTITFLSESVCMKSLTIYVATRRTLTRLPSPSGHSWWHIHCIDVGILTNLSG